jgi:hypothetical protein
VRSGTDLIVSTPRGKVVPVLRSGDRPGETEEGKPIYELLFLKDESLTMPEDDIDCVDAPLPDPIGKTCTVNKRFGTFTLDADGNAYTGVQTPDDFEIWKWEWVE